MEIWVLFATGGMVATYYFSALFQTFAFKRLDVKHVNFYHSILLGNGFIIQATTDHSPELQV